MNQTQSVPTRGRRPSLRDVGELQLVDNLRRRGVRLPELGIGVAVILISVIGSLWWQSRGAGSIRIAIAAHDVRAGDQIVADDISLASVSSDTRLEFIGATDAAELVGVRATSDVKAGTPFVSGMFSKVAPLGSSESLVGVVVDASRAPVEVVSGDIVDVVALDRDPMGADVVTTIVRRAAVWSVSIPLDVLDERSVTLRVPASVVSSFVGHDEVHLMKAGS